MEAIKNAAARGHFFIAAYDGGLTATAATPAAARAYFADRLSMYRDEKQAHAYITAAAAVRFVYWTEKQATKETIHTAEQGHVKTDELNAILESVKGKKKADGENGNERYIYHIGDAARTEQLITAYTRNGNNDGGDLYDVIYDTTERFINMYEAIYTKDTNRPITDLLDVEPARDEENGEPIPNEYRPAPVFIPFYHLTEENPAFNADKPETRENPRQRTIYRAIFRDMEDYHRRIFYTAGALSLDYRPDTKDGDGDTIGDMTPNTATADPAENVITKATTKAAYAALEILGKSDSQISAALKKLTTRDECGHIIPADPATWENFTRRARLALDSPTPELARHLHTLNLASSNHLLKNAYNVIAILRQTAKEEGDAITYNRLSSTLKAIQDKRQQEKKRSEDDPEALKEALAYLKEYPQAPTPAAILARLSPAQKRQLSTARRQNSRSRTEFFSGDYRRAALIDALKHATQKADEALSACLDALPIVEERPTGKAAEIENPAAVLIPKEHRPTYYLSLSPRQAQILRRMKRNEETTADRLRVLTTDGATPTSIAAAVIEAERRRYGETPDKEIIEALILYAAKKIYSLRTGRAYGSIIWEPTERELLTALQKATAAAEVVHATTTPAK